MNDIKFNVFGVDDKQSIYPLYISDIIIIIIIHIMPVIDPIDLQMKFLSYFIIFEAMIHISSCRK